MSTDGRYRSDARRLNNKEQVYFDKTVVMYCLKTAIADDSIVGISGSCLHIMCWVRDILAMGG